MMLMTINALSNVPPDLAWFICIIAIFVLWLVLVFLMKRADDENGYKKDNEDDDDFSLFGDD